MISPDKIHLTPEQKNYIAQLAELEDKPWEEVLQDILDRYVKNQTATHPQPTPRRKAGSAKGKIWMAPDFDAPLEEFKDYM